MTKSKKEEIKPIDTPVLPKSPFAGVSRFGKPTQFGNQRFSAKGITTRPTFVTQHKGGGGK